MKKSTVTALLGILFVLLAGCSFHSPEELYTLPEPPAEFKTLNAQILSTMSQLNAEYAAPLSGSNSQTVQLQDIDGDGTDEVVAFFRVASDPTPLKIYVYKQNPNDGYDVFSVIEGEGTAIQSISYENLGGSPSPEIIVSWRMSDKVHSLAAYTLHRNSVTEMMRTGYSDWCLIDIDMDNLREIAILQLDAVDGNSRAELYNYQSEQMVLCAAAPLSFDIQSIVSTRSGFLMNSVQALFVTSLFGENGGLITDIFAWNNNTLENITIRPAAGQSLSTIRYYNPVDCTDINGDNVVELPTPAALPSTQKSGASEFWSIRWDQYDRFGKSIPVFTTYHNLQDRWYLILPEHWLGKLALSRRDNTVNGERAVVFSHWPGEDSPSTPFLTIYKLTGANREIRSRMGNRFVLLTQPDAIYAAELLPCDWDCGLDEAALIESFRLMRIEWSGEQ